MNQQDDLSKQLNSFTISSGEDKITEALHNTHITSTPSVPSIFSLPIQPLPSQQPTVYSGDVQNKTNYNNNNTANTTSDWDPSSSSQWNTHSSQPTIEEEDGWGDGPPSYTSISQGTYFGFNSIMEAPNAMLTRPAHTETNTHTTAFSRFKHMPVTFTSAAAEAGAGAGAGATKQQ